MKATLPIEVVTQQHQGENKHVTFSVFGKEFTVAYAEPYGTVEVDLGKTDAHVSDIYDIDTLRALVNMAIRKNNADIQRMQNSTSWIKSYDNNPTIRHQAQTGKRRSLHA